MQPVKSAPVPQPCAKPTSKPALCAPHSLTLSISSTLMEMESTVSSGRSTPAMMNGHSSAGSSAAKTVAYACCWDLCPQCFSCSPDLAEHIRGIHVDGQRGGVSSRERSNCIDSVCVRGQVFIEQAEKWSKKQFLGMLTECRLTSFFLFFFFFANCISVAFCGISRAETIK